MKTLRQVAGNDPSWSLDELVAVANELLPQFLPAQRAHTRIREDVTPRLVRHYTSQGRLDEPLKSGRYAVYTYRHLLQVLLVRRLLAEGYGASAIGDLAVSKTDTELEALLEGGVQLTVEAANPALGFLEQIRRRQSVTIAEPTQDNLKGFTVPPSPSPDRRSTRWKRIEILPGLELHVREDFNYPNSLHERQNLIQLITHILSTHRRSPK